MTQEVEQHDLSSRGPVRKPRRLRLIGRDMAIAGISISVVGVVYTIVMVWSVRTGSGARTGTIGGVGGATLGMCGAFLGCIPAWRMRGLKAKLRASRGWLCPECEYTLDPEPTGPCPECGWHATPERVKRAWAPMIGWDEKIDFPAREVASGSDGGL